ncbi:MAG: aspartate carbamoyltransferase catalytic subunit [Thermoanaerobaculia bacterium]
MTPKTPIRWRRKDLLGIAELSPEEIGLILDTAESFAEIGERAIKKVPTLRGKTVLNLFFEASTRTRSSFEIAEKRLSADNINFSTSGSALEKGETLIDTALNLQAMAPDLVVIRHAHPGVPHMLAKRIEAGVINAGDGAHEHPTQGLLDLYTIRRRLGNLKGVKVAIIGDIAHSRVARSTAKGLRAMGAQVTFVGPPTLLPPGGLGFATALRPEDVLADTDVIYLLRLQLERGTSTYLPSVGEFIRLYQLDARRLAMAPEHAIVMHPGPMNRGVEIAPDVADLPRAAIEDQVTAGVAVRMALLYLLLGGLQEAVA